MPRRTSQYLSSLAEVPLFAALSQRDLARLARLGEEVEVEAGTRLVDEGATGDQFFVILKGRAKVTRRGRRIASLARGNSFGELSLLDRGPRTATVTAETRMELLVLGQREFSGLLDDAPGFSRKLLAGMAARLREADTRNQ
jgi:CRP-like cAMP-binding protein